jgi:hypothetical protein
LGQATARNLFSVTLPPRMALCSDPKINASIPVLDGFIWQNSAVMKHKRRHDIPVTLEQLLQEQAAVAYCMAMDGPVYAPVLERYEREIAALLARDDAMSRAHRILQGHAALAARGGVKAIA